jgi:hypothetical protein
MDREVIEQKLESLRHCLQRGENKPRYLYVLTPKGVRQRMQLTRSFLARKERGYEMLNSQIVLLRQELAAQAEGQT